LKPFIEVGIGPFNFQFDLGGVNLSFNPTVNLNLNFGGNTAGRDVDSNPPVYLTPSDSEECPPVDLTPVITAVNAARDNVNSNTNTKTDRLVAKVPSLAWRTVASGVESGVVALAGTDVLVEVTMSSLPRNVKAQYGGGNAPNVTYAGWGSFGGLGMVGGARTPLDYDVTRLPVTPFASSFTFTATRGRLATVRVAQMVVANKTVLPSQVVAWEVL
jgi:hypothetical protein